MTNEVILLTAGCVELVLRVVPTKKDFSLTSLTYRIFDKIFPNRRK